MTYKYLDSKRISGLSTDATAVSGGWKELGRTTLSNTPTGTADYTAGSTSYGTGDSGSAVDLQTQVGSTLGNSWTLRFKLTMTSKANNLIFMVQDINTIDETTTRDGIGLRQTASTSYYDLEGCNGTAPTGGQYDHRFTTTPAIDTKYVQITRVSETSASIQFWNSTYTTVSESSDNIPIADITNLRYFVIYNNGSAFTIDEVSFWNNSASTGAGDNITVSGLADKRYYMVLGSTTNGSGGGTQQSLQFNGDGASNYGRRYNSNGSEASSMATRISTGANPATSSLGYTVGYVANKSDKNKMVVSSGVDTYGSNAPSKYMAVGKWQNASDAINSITIHNPTSGNFDGGSECIVLGYDPDDTHTDNFWTELKNVSGDGTSSFDTGSFALKKYLWIQVYIDRSGGSNNTEFTCGTGGSLDTGANYARRINEDGGADETANMTAQSKMESATYGEEEFYNMFVLNTSTHSKIFTVKGNNSSSTQSHILQASYKWVNNAQMNIFGVSSGGSNTLSTSSRIKVWGSD